MLIFCRLLKDETKLRFDWAMKKNLLLYKTNIDICNSAKH